MRDKFPALFDLPIEERIELAMDLWDSIAENPDALTLTDEEREELERRLEACKNDPEGESPWEEVKKRLIKKITRSRRAALCNRR